MADKSLISVIAKALDECDSIVFFKNPSDSKIIDVHLTKKSGFKEYYYRTFIDTRALEMLVCLLDEFAANELEMAFVHFCNNVPEIVEITNGSDRRRRQPI